MKFPTITGKDLLFTYKKIYFEEEEAWLHCQGKH